MLTLLTPWLALLATMAEIDAPPAPSTTAAAVPAQTAEVWSLSLAEAIRLGLANSPVVKVVAAGPDAAPPAGYSTWDAGKIDLPLGCDDLMSRSVAPPAVGPNGVRMVVAPVGDDMMAGPFRVALLAHVRSVEQQYWALSLMQTTLASREDAVRQAGEILDRERAELKQGRATTADIAEGEQQLENFKLNLVTAQSDLATTERQLRNILGLPRDENRRIVPTTLPTKAKCDPNWEASLAQMLVFQPDVVEQRNTLAVAALKQVFAGEDKNLAEPVRSKIDRDRDSQLKFFRDLISQTTHSLARFFLEVDANYKQYQTAAKLKAAAGNRLEAQMSFYHEGRFAIDRLLDAVSQNANAAAQEAQYLTSYNSSIAAFEESKGTLLDFDGITIVLPLKTRSVTPTPGPDRVAPAPTATNSTTYKVRASVAGVKLIDVEVEKTSAPAASPPQ